MINLKIIFRRKEQHHYLKMAFIRGMNYSGVFVIMPVVSLVTFTVAAAYMREQLDVVKIFYITALLS